MKLFCEERSDEWKGTSEVSKGRIVSNIWKIVSYTAIDDVCEEGSDEMKVSNRQYGCGFPPALTSQYSIKMKRNSDTASVFFSLKLPSAAAL